jgi:NADPH:quinone reductase-like Zn-dependent oxidoreductase
MNAVKITAFGAPENMIWSEYPDPICGAEEVIIEIYAAVSIDLMYCSERTLSAPKERLPILLVWRLQVYY